jgi:hypothetical protein
MMELIHAFSKVHFDIIRFPRPAEGLVQVKHRYKGYSADKKSTKQRNSTKKNVAQNFSDLHAIASM